MATNKTMFNYFTKLPSKSTAEEENPRKSAPVFNKQHVKEFQVRLEQFDAELLNVGTDIDYISSIRTGQHKPYRILTKPKGSLRARLLQFCEDVRPPYFGTWQKKSTIITGRRPDKQDNEVFDYEVDSEAEWDIGGPGESLKGDDSEDDEELDDYEIDMKTFVPHGYVSDDEVESDHDENPVEANRSLNEDCDVEDDSNSDIKIISVSGIPRQVDHHQTAPPPPKQTPKMEIKPVILGLNFEDKPSLSETKLQFLRSFQGVSCT